MRLPGKMITSMTRGPANRLGLDYHAAPARKVACPIVDAHCHIHVCAQTDAFFDAAQRYGITAHLTMTPLADAPALRERRGDRVGFIAIPNWKSMADSREFIDQWMADLDAFWRLGARVCKFWMAPRIRKDLGWTLEHAAVRPVIDHAKRLGYRFMVHVGDPSVWWGEGKPYANTRVFGTKLDQYPPLEWFLDHVAPATVIAAHLGGFVEDPSFLDGLLERHGNLVLDSSATKWIVREVARRPEEVRELMLRRSDRILFGSDLVVRDSFEGFDHYASRYWSHQMMWETPWRGESPIDDPDADDPPKLAGLDLPAGVLEAMYVGNVRRLGLIAAEG